MSAKNTKISAALINGSVREKSMSKVRKMSGRVIVGRKDRKAGIETHRRRERAQRE